MKPPENKNEILELFKRGPGILENALAGLSDTELDYVSSNGGWSIRQIVHHLVDGDDLWKMYNSYTAKEWSLLTNSSFSAAEKQMDALMGIYNLEKITIKSGSLWRKKSINN